MKVNYKSGNCEFVVEAETVKKAFEAVAGLREVFTGEPCGCCKKTNVVPEMREHGGFTFYSLRCLDCHAQLDFGQRKEGGELFSKRWDGEKKCSLPNNGWYMYQANGKAETTQRPRREHVEEECPPSLESPPPTDEPPWNVADHADTMKSYQTWFLKKPTIEELNAEAPEVAGLAKKTRDEVLKMVHGYAKSQKWTYRDGIYVK